MKYPLKDFCQNGLGDYFLVLEGQERTVRREESMSSGNNWSCESRW